MLKDRRVAWGLFVVCFLLVWNLLDFAYTTFLTGNLWHCSAGRDGGMPLLIAMLTGYFAFGRER